ncbi:hypothetical protein MRX96_025311 [Rhipicephalus microplus]
MIQRPRLQHEERDEARLLERPEPIRALLSGASGQRGIAEQREREKGFQSASNEKGDDVGLRLLSLEFTKVYGGVLRSPGPIQNC